VSINCYQCVHHWSDFEPIKGSVAIPVVWIGGINYLEVLEDIKSIEGCHKNIFAEGSSQNFPDSCEHFQQLIIEDSSPY
jgi:hypothetical protein